MILPLFGLALGIDLIGAIQPAAHFIITPVCFSHRLVKIPLRQGALFQFISEIRDLIVIPAIRVKILGHGCRSPKIPETGLIESNRFQRFIATAPAILRAFFQWPRLHPCLEPPVYPSK